MLFQHAEMDEDVAFAVVGNKESESARRVEPFDATRTMLTIWKRFRRRGHCPLRHSFLSCFVTQTLHIRPLTRYSCVGKPT